MSIKMESVLLSYYLMYMQYIAYTNIYIYIYIKYDF